MAHGSQARLGLNSCASLGPPLARSEKVLPGVEEAVKMMRSGDVWELAVPGKLGFGEKGRSASPGKPRIPSNADLTFLVELVAVPGKDDEILEVTGGGD